MVKNNIEEYNSIVDEENELLRKIDIMNMSIINCKRNIKVAQFIEKSSLGVAILSVLSGVVIPCSDISLYYLIISGILLGCSLNCALYARIYSNAENGTLKKNNLKLDGMKSDLNSTRSILREFDITLDPSMTNNKDSLSDEISLTNNNNIFSKPKIKTRNINDENK